MTKRTIKNDTGNVACLQIYDMQEISVSEVMIDTTISFFMSLF